MVTFLGGIGPHVGHGIVGGIVSSPRVDDNTKNLHCRSGCRFLIIYVDVIAYRILRYNSVRLSLSRVNVLPDILKVHAP